MAVFNVKKTGTKTTGASTAGDWSDANCYSSIQTALNQTADGDSVILDDDDWVVTTAIVSTSLAYDGSVTIVSRSADPALCSLKCSSASVGVFRTLNTGNSQNFTLQGLTLGKTVTHTGNSAAPIFQAAQQTGDVRLVDCIIEDVDYDSDRNAAGGLLAQSSAAASKKLTLEDVIIRRINWVNSAETSYLGTVNEGHTLEVIGTLTIEDVNANGIGFGGFACSGDISILGEVNIARVAITAADSTVAVIFQDDTSTACFIQRIQAEDIAVSGATARAAVLDLRGPHTVVELECEDVYVNNTTETAGLGCCYVSSGTLGVGDIGSIIARRCNSNYGAAAYLSQGASAVIGRVLAIDCYSYTGIVYKGGWGDLDLFAYLSINCGYLGEEANLPAEAGLGGLALYAHVHSAATSNSRLRVWNMTAFNPGAILPAVMLRSLTAGFDLTAEIRNSILWCPDATDQIVCDVAATCALLSTLDTNVIKGGAAAINEDEVVGTHTKTWAGTIDTDPALNAEGAATTASLIGTAKPIAFPNPFDARGRLRRNPPSYGGVEYAARGRTASVGRPTSLQRQTIARVGS